MTTRTKKTIADITGDIGPLEAQVKYPMYSFNRAAYNFWQGIYTGLRQQGRSHKQAIDILQSKFMRWEFDGTLADMLQAIGRSYALEHGKEWKL